MSHLPKSNPLERPRILIDRWVCELRGCLHAERSRHGPDDCLVSERERHLAESLADRKALRLRAAGSATVAVSFAEG